MDRRAGTRCGSLSSCCAIASRPWCFCTTATRERRSAASSRTTFPVHSSATPTAFEEAYAHLDAPCWQAARDGGFESWQPHLFQGERQPSYGPTYACLPHRADASYGALLRRLGWTRTVARLARSLSKRRTRMRSKGRETS